MLESKWDLPYLDCVLTSFISVNEITETIIRKIYTADVGLNNLKFHFKTETKKLEQNKEIINKFRTNMMQNSTQIKHDFKDKNQTHSFCPQKGLPQKMFYGKRIFSCEIKRHNEIKFSCLRTIRLSGKRCISPPGR